MTILMYILILIILSSFVDINYCFPDQGKWSFNVKEVRTLKFIEKSSCLKCFLIAKMPLF